MSKKTFTTKDINKIKTNLHKSGAMPVLDRYSAKSVGYKTFKGMIYQLRVLNNQLKKCNGKADFVIRLPIVK